MRVLVWLVRAFVFFALFAFSLNNQELVVVHWFFGVDWHTPLVIVVLAAFGCGAVVGVLAMMPNWWRRRRQAKEGAPLPPAGGPPSTLAPSTLTTETPALHDGL